MHAVFFDVDGTLFDTRADLAATVNHTRRDLGFPELPVETVITHVGQGARYLLEHAIPEAKVPYEQLWEIFRSHYAEHCCETDAQSVRACAAKLGGHRLSSHDWMVGDSWTDMQAASNAGIKGAFCTFGFGRLNDSRFTVKINRFEELLRHLKAEE